MFKAKTLDELNAIARGAMRALIDGANVSDGSDYDISARMVSAIGEGNQSHAQSLARQVFPSTSDADMLIEHAHERGIEKLPAAAALGKVQIVASAGTETQGAGSVLTHQDGTTFSTTEPGTIALPAWTGKACSGNDSSVQRIIVTPNVSGMFADEIVEIDGHQRAIREVIASISAIDFYEPLPSAPVALTAINPVRGVVVDVVCDEVGAHGNKPTGETLTLSGPATGVLPTVRVLELSAGGDAETDEELRARVVDFDAMRPGGGNVEHIRELARTTPGIRVADAVVFPSFRGLGSLDVRVIGLATARVVGAAATQRVADRLAAELPYAADILVEPLLYTVAEYDVTITVETDVGYERDYVDAGHSVAAAPASTASRVYLTSTLVGIAEVGDRVIVSVNSAGAWRAYQRTIDAIGASGGQFWIDLDKPLPAAPTSSSPQVLPGGPLAEPVIAALEALFDSLGPSRQVVASAYSYERHPLPSFRWDDTLRLAAINASVMALDGAVNLTITTPATDQQPGPQETIRRGKFTIRFTES
jgi:uncharacterized phage protein gp47/JayE